MTHKKAIELGFSFTNYIYISAGGIKVLLTSVEQSSTTEFAHCFGTLVCPSSRAREATQNHIFPCQCLARDHAFRWYGQRFCFSFPVESRRRIKFHKWTPDRWNNYNFDPLLLCNFGFGWIRDQVASYSPYIIDFCRCCMCVKTKVRPTQPYPCTLTLLLF